MMDKTNGGNLAASATAEAAAGNGISKIRQDHHSKLKYQPTPNQTPTICRQARPNYAKQRAIS